MNVTNYLITVLENQSISVRDKLLAYFIVVYKVVPFFSYVVFWEIFYFCL